MPPELLEDLILPPLTPLSLSICVGKDVYLIQRLKSDGLELVMIRGPKLEMDDAPMLLEPSSASYKLKRNAHSKGSTSVGVGVD
nr:hypothetical protein [Tanacetum cinerariifolium]